MIWEADGFPFTGVYSTIPTLRNKKPVYEEK